MKNEFMNAMASGDADAQKQQWEKFGELMKDFGKTFTDEQQQYQRERGN